MNLIVNSIPKFLTFLEKNRGSTPVSVRTYRQVLEFGKKHLTIKEEDGVWIVDLMEFRSQIAHQSKGTIGKKISIIRSYLDWLKESELKKIKVKNQTQIKLPKKLPKPIKINHIQEALESCDQIERLILVMLYGLGVRISELSGIRLEAIKPQWIKVLGKGSKERTIPIPFKVYEEIEIFLKTNEPKEFLFEIDRKKLSENQLRYKINKIFKRIGLKVTPHQLRHSYATDLLNSGARITDVSELLGHSALSTTEIYTKLSSSLKLENYLKAHPMCEDS